MQINIPFIHNISFMYFMNKLIERRRKRGENSEIYKEYLLSSKDRLACLLRPNLVANCHSYV